MRRGFAFVRSAPIRHDLSSIRRGFVRRPAAFLLPAVTLTLVIGVGAAVFAVVNGSLLRPLPFPEEQRLVRVFTLPPGASEVRTRNPLASVDFVRFRERTRSLDRLEVMWQRERGLIGVGDPLIVKAGSVSAGFFDLLGGRTVLGRTFTHDEDVPGSSVAVVGFGLWQRVFGGDPAIIGRHLTIDGEAHVVIGVMSADFQPMYRESELWTPLGVNNGNMPLPNATYLVSVGRLAADRSLPQAQQEFARLMADLANEAPNRRGWTAGVVTLRDYQFGERRPALLVVGTMALLLMVIAGSNIANVTLARMLARKDEFELRVSLGATFGDVLRLVCLETLVTYGVAGMGGLLLARTALPLMLSLDPDAARALGPVALDWRVQGATFGAAFALAYVSGVWPAIIALRHIGPGVGQCRTRMTRSRRARQFQSLLVTAQTAVALIVLVTGGVLVEAYMRLSVTPPGFEPSNVLTAQVRLSTRYATHEQRIQFMDRLLQGIRARPDVLSAAAVNNAFVSGFTYGTLFEVEGQPTADGQMRGANFRRISPGYLTTMRIPLRSGRDIAESDQRTAPWVALVSESLARQVWPNQSPIGHRVKRTEPGTGWMTVVGVVADVRDVSLTEGPDPTLYVSQEQQLPTGQPLALVVRTRSEPSTISHELRAAMTTLDPTQVIDRFVPLGTFVTASLGPDRFRTALLVVFATTGVLLALVGLFGLTARSVSERTRELGVRIALGAAPGTLWIRVTMEALVSVAVGVVAGGLGAVLTGRVLARVLLGVSPPSLALWAAVSASLGVICVIAAAVPAHRIMHLDPSMALRSE
jgi:putative ABC transport system permease protein